MTAQELSSDKASSSMPALDEPALAKDEPSRQGMAWKFYSGLAFSMLCSLGVIGYLEWKDVSSRKFVPKRILLDAQGHQDHANLIFDVDADAMPKSLSMRDMGCMIKMPCNGEETCTVFNAEYDGHVESNQFDASTVQLRMRLTHGGLRLNRMMRAIRQENLGIADIKVECDVTLAYMRLHPIVAPEFTTTYASSLKEVVEKMKPLLGSDAEGPYSGKKMPYFHSRSAYWYFERTSRVTPRLRKLSVHGEVEGNAKFYIPPGKLADNIYNILTDIPVYVQADVSYWETTRKAFHAGVFANGRIGAKYNRYGAVTLKMPVKTNTSMGLPMVAMMSRAYNRPEERVISVSSEPRSFFGHVLGSTKQLAVKDQISVTEGITWPELASIAREHGGRGLQEVTMTRGQWNVMTSLEVIMDMESSFNITAYVNGGTPLTMGVTVAAKNVEERYDWKDGGKGESEWVEQSIVGIGVHASYNDDTEDWSGDLFLNVTRRETGDGTRDVKRPPDFEDNRFHVAWAYHARKMSAAISWRASEDVVEGWNDAAKKWTTDESSSFHKISIAVDFKDDFPALPKRASIVMDIDADEMPHTEIVYTMGDTAGDKEQHKIELIQRNSTLYEEASRFNAGKMWTDYAWEDPAQGGLIYGAKAVKMNDGDAVMHEDVAIKTSMSMTLNIIIDKSDKKKNAKWKVTVKMNATGACEIDKFEDSKTMSTDLRDKLKMGDAGIGSETNLRCGECEDATFDDDSVHARKASCSSLSSNPRWGIRQGVVLNDNPSPGSASCCIVDYGLYYGRAFTTPSCCKTNMLLSMYDEMNEDGVGSSMKESFDFEMDAIDMDEKTQDLMISSDDEDWPKIDADVETKDGLLLKFIVSKFDEEKQKDVEEVRVNFRFKHLNDMNLDVAAKDAFTLDASGTAPTTVENDGVHINGKIVDSDGKPVIKMSLVSEWLKDIITITNAGAFKLKDGADAMLDVNIYDDKDELVFETTGSMKMKSLTATSNIEAECKVFDHEVKEADFKITLDTNPDKYELDASVTNKDGKTWNATSTMPKVGEFFGGNVKLTDDKKESEYFYTAFNDGFKPMTTQRGFDRWNMNISLGKDGQGIDGTAVEFDWYVERGPEPVRAFAETGMQLTGYETEDPHKRVIVSADLGMPYDIARDPNSKMGVVTNFASALKMKNTAEFDVKKYIARLAKASGLTSTQQVSVKEIKHEFKVGWNVDGTVTEAQAKTAVAGQASVTEDKVSVKLSQTTGGRRLSRQDPSFGDSSASARRLATNIEATITTDDAAALNAAAGNLEDTASLKTQLDNAGASITAVPDVSQTPEKTVKVITQLLSDAGTPAVPPPNEAVLSQGLSEDLGTQVTASVDESSIEQGQTEVATFTTSPPPTSPPTTPGAGAGPGTSAATTIGAGTAGDTTTNNATIPASTSGGLYTSTANHCSQRVLRIICALVVFSLAAGS